MNRLFTAAISTMLAGPALADPGSIVTGSTTTGLLHPLLGLDHVLAMVAVGLLAIGQGPRARLILPGSFVLAMALGISTAAAGIGVPLVEPMIFASLLVLGALIGLALRVPLAAGTGLVGLFGMFHGAAHGAELGQAAALPFAFGVLATTAVLHGLGVVIGSFATRRPGPQSQVQRLFGLAIGLGGLAISLV